MLKEKPNAEALPLESSAGLTLKGRYLAPPGDGDGKQWIRTTALIQADPDELYAIWRDVEKAPLWQEQISSCPGDRPQNVALGDEIQTTTPSNGNPRSSPRNRAKGSPGARFRVTRTMPGKSSSSTLLAGTERWSLCCRNFRWANGPASGRRSWGAIRNKQSSKTFATLRRWRKPARFLVLSISLTANEAVSAR